MPTTTAVTSSPPGHVLASPFTTKSSYRGLVIHRTLRSPSVLVAELHTAEGAIPNSCDQDEGPDASDNGTDGQDQDVEPGKDEWFAFGNHERLYWLVR